MIPCRVLTHASSDGPGNMALDEALLDAVAADPSAAVFRTYAWSVPTLSLGYFQPAALVEADPRWRSVPVVRRPTGGGALCHDREVTYAVVVPRDHSMARRNLDLYTAVHRAIAALLAEGGIDARPHGEGEAERGPGRPFLCFADRDPRDVVVGPHKLVGSAQRRRAGAVLQHGSIILGGSPLTPEFPGASDLAQPTGNPEEWGVRLARAIPNALGLRAVAGELTAEDLLRAERLAASAYRNPSWNLRR